MTSTSPAAGDVGPIASAEIMQMLSHRYPFLLIDRVAGCVPGRSIAGYKNITRGDCGARAATAPGCAGMPVLLVLEALAQLSVVLVLKTLGWTPAEEAPMFFFAGIDDARFGVGVQPGDRLELESTIVRLMPARGVGKFSVRATVGGQCVAEATLMAAMPSRRAEAVARP
jgi:3-hydroxyacyl-[acyl-carrier-protein] dehydratase